VSRSGFFLGPTLLTLLLGIGLYGAFCVNVQPTVQPAPSPTVVLVLPPTTSPSPDVFTVPPTPTMTPTAQESILVPLPKPTRTPRPTATPEPTQTPVVPMRQRGSHEIDAVAPVHG
jgi:hypothetical protein